MLLQKSLPVCPWCHTECKDWSDTNTFQEILQNKNSQTQHSLRNQVELFTSSVDPALHHHYMWLVWIWLQKQISADVMTRWQDDCSHVWGTWLDFKFIEGKKKTKKNKNAAPWIIRPVCLKYNIRTLQWSSPTVKPERFSGDENKNNRTWKQTEETWGNRAVFMFSERSW